MTISRTYSTLNSQVGVIKSVFQMVSRQVVFHLSIIHAMNYGSSCWNRTNIPLRYKIKYTLHLIFKRVLVASTSVSLYIFPISLLFSATSCLHYLVCSLELIRDNNLQVIYVVALFFFIGFNSFYYLASC